MLARWKETRHSIDVVIESIEEVHGSNVESPLFNAIENSFDAYTEALDLLLGAGDWLPWYCAENEMGARGHGAGYDGNIKPISNLEDLWCLIVESRKREVA
jgi:hypothetical protein